MKSKTIFKCDSCDFRFATRLEMDFCPRCGKDSLTMLSVEPDYNISDEHTQEMADNVLSHACYLCEILQEDLLTGTRDESMTYCRKLTSKTLHEMGYGGTEINKYLGKYLGERSTILHQIAACGVWSVKTHPKFFNLLVGMRDTFIHAKAG